MKNNASADALLSARAVRESTRALFDWIRAGGGHFAYHPEKLSSVVERVLGTIRRNYPSLDIPFHSRWGHFRAGGRDRVAELDTKLAKLDPRERARIKFDLVIPSVLLDAGAGAAWRFTEDGQKIGRSEGLGVASYRLFESGKLSADGASLRSDIAGLRNLTADELARAFQVSATNPLIGVDGRVGLLNRLACALENRALFKDGRPGNLVDLLVERHGTTIPATGVLRSVLDGLGPIWPGRLEIDGVNLGDIWKHAATDELVAFHKLSQWMTYSLIEPLMESGLEVTGVSELTGLAEYRNGGLILDAGLISLKRPADVERKWKPSEDLILEWRALTVATLDLIGAEVQKRLGKSPEEFPLAKVLEGGTWRAGREIAAELRPATGEPPLALESDGTVF